MISDNDINNTFVFNNSGTALGQKENKTCHGTNYR